MELFFLIGLIASVSIAVYFFAQLMLCQEKKEDKSGIYVSFTIPNSFITLKSKFMSVVLSDTQFIEGQVQTVNKKGRPAPIQTGSIEYSSSNEAVATVTEDPNDETKFAIKAVGAGTTQINYSADADLGEGVVPISGFTDVEVTPAQATGFNVTFGEPQEQEPTEPEV